MATKKQSAKEPAFEEALEELESIVEAMESEKMPLAELVENYEKGTQLLKVCQGRIEAAQKKIEVIAKNAGENDLSLKAFDPDSEEPDSGEESEETEDGDDEIKLL